MKTSLLLAFLGVTFFLGSCQKEKVTMPVEIIPEPLSIIQKKDFPFIVKGGTKIVIADSIMLPAADLLQSCFGQDLPIIWNSDDRKGNFCFLMDPSLEELSNEGYRIRVSDQGVEVSAPDVKGLFYGAQTIRQLLPVDGSEEIVIPAVEITDSPRFRWRGMHLDVSRHFMPLDFIKRYIDYLAMHKLNVFHWHLVDGIGWRIEIKSHPELTEIGAWRQVKEGKKPWQEFEVWREGCGNKKYGGFYTQKEIREVVKYAGERQITVIPEIELPGHSEVVMQCYPNLICKDSNGDALRNIGVYCASNDACYSFLEEVLDEVIDLFPSEYIHIGGDEVGKSNWEKCAGCRKLMKQKGYSPHQLQSHFVNHFEKYLRAKGRKLIGWHEILEGELSSGATIMYWGGENGVAGYLKRGHPTVLTTGSHLYFDHYQSLSKQEPKAFGGFAPLKKVYDYEPIPEGLDAKYANLVMGVQANVWTEYMATPERVEYMIFPRISALSEIAWSKQKDWPHFRSKMKRMIDRYRAMGVNFARSAYRPEVDFSLVDDGKKMKVKIETELEGDIYYTVDGSEPGTGSKVKYTGPFILEKSTTIKMLVEDANNQISLSDTKKALLHKGNQGEVTLNSKPSARYSAEGGSTLVDSNFGGNKWGNGRWIGVLGKDFEAILEFKNPALINKIGISCIEETGAGIYFPAGMEVLLSEDGIHYKSLKKQEFFRNKQTDGSGNIKTKVFWMEFDSITGRYLKVKAPYRRIKNKGVFIFMDEIIVE